MKAAALSENVASPPLCGAVIRLSVYMVVVYILGWFYRKGHISLTYTDAPVTAVAPDQPLYIWQFARQRRMKVLNHNRKYLPANAVFMSMDDDEMTEHVKMIANVMESQGVVVGACEAFFLLRPAAYRIDLWKAMVMWMYGGLYMHERLILAAPIDKWLDINSDHLVLPHDRATSDQAVWSKLLFSRPRHAVWIYIIKHILKNIECRLYGDETSGPLSITGPIAYGEGFQQHGIQLRSRVRRDLTFLETKEAGLQTWEGFTYEAFLALEGDSASPLVLKEAVASTDAKGDSPNSYSYHWQRHMVYCDDDGPSCRGVQVRATPMDMCMPQPREESADNARFCLEGKLVPELYVLGGTRCSSSEFGNDIIRSGIYTTRELGFTGTHFFVKTYDSQSASGVTWDLNSVRIMWYASLPSCFASDLPPEGRIVLADLTPDNLRFVPFGGDYVPAKTPELIEGPKLEELHVAKTLKHMYGEASKRLTFVILMREPMSRMQSAWYHSFRTEVVKGLPGWPATHSQTFAEDLLLSLTEARDHGRLTSLLWTGFYGRQLLQYFEFHDPSQFVSIPFKYYTDLAKQEVVDALQRRLSKPLDFRTIVEPEPHGRIPLEKDVPADVRRQFNEFVFPEKLRLCNILVKSYRKGMSLPGFSNYSNVGNITRASVEEWLDKGW